MTPEQLKASILQRAMEGKLVPQDPNDEPASELLKKIKAEKEKLIKEGKIKRDKNETEIFRGDDGLHYEKFQDGSVKQVDVPFEIPESWEWVRFNNIASILRGGSPRPIKDFLTDSIDGINWIKIGDTEKSGKYITDTREKIKKSGLSKTRLVKKGSFLLTNSMSFGRPYILKIDGAIHDGWLSISDFKSSITEDFLYYFLLSRVAYSQFLQLISGAVVKNLNSEKVASIFIPIPPLNEQARITQKIEQALSQVDDYHELFNTLRKLNNSFPEKLRKSILQYAMQGKLVPQDSADEPVEVLLERVREEKQKLFAEGKLKKKDLQESIIYQDDDNSYYENCPKTWAKVSLATISKITSGGTPKTNITEYYNGEILWLTPADLSKAQSKYYLDISLKSITRLGLENSSAQLVKANSIVYSSRAPIGYINIVPKQYTTNQGCKSLTPYLVIVKWLYFAMKYATTDIKKIASGTTFLEISASKLGDFYIGLPPLREQERIAKKIERLWNKVDSLPFTL